MNRSQRSRRFIIIGSVFLSGEFISGIVFFNVLLSGEFISGIVFFNVLLYLIFLCFVMVLCSFRWREIKMEKVSDDIVGEIKIE